MNTAGFLEILVSLASLPYKLFLCCDSFLCEIKRFFYNHGLNPPVSDSATLVRVVESSADDA